MTLFVCDPAALQMDKSIILLGDACETCERIFSSPVPLVYTRHTARFLSTWLLLLPFGLYEVHLPTSPRISPHLPISLDVAPLRPL